MGSRRDRAKPDVVSEPKPGKKDKYKRGKHGDWSKEAMEAAAGCWALRSQMGNRSRKAPPIDLIKDVQQKVKVFYTPCDFHPWEMLHFDHLKGHDQTHMLFSYELHPYVAAYIITIEKVRRRYPIDKPAFAIFTWVPKKVKLPYAPERTDFYMYVLAQVRLLNLDYFYNAKRQQRMRIKQPKLRFKAHRVTSSDRLCAVQKNSNTIFVVENWDQALKTTVPKQA